jgi:hypothetical protein
MLDAASRDGRRRGQLEQFQRKPSKLRRMKNMLNIWRMHTARTLRSRMKEHPY